MDLDTLQLLDKSFVSKELEEFFTNVLYGVEVETACEQLKRRASSHIAWGLRSHGRQNALLFIMTYCKKLMIQ